MSCCLQVKMELLSDAIFGSGYSVPGGEDISVCLDEQGYPYVKGSTLKGLLRESLENLCAWNGRGQEETDALFGSSGWNGTAENRRLCFSALTLDDPPCEPEECFEDRVFTSLESGVVKPQTLRTAVCVCRGQSFSGEIWCDPGDIALLKKGLRGIKWAGCLRGRGFGRIRISAEEQASLTGQFSLPPSRCIHYLLRTEKPVTITNLSRSGGNGYETRGYIPGTAIRGMIMSMLTRNAPEFFSANKSALLSEQTRFSDAVPNPGELAVLPSIRGFYEDKGETHLENVVIQSGKLTAGYKRAKLGTFCTLQGSSIRYWSASSGSTMRLNRNAHDSGEPLPFRTRYLDAGQTFEGWILLDDPSLAPGIAQAFPHTVFLGADRYAGFGKCTIVRLECADAPAWIDAYSFQTQAEIGKSLCLLAVSPLAMLDNCGTPCGLHLEQLAQKLDVRHVKASLCGTTLAEFGGYNRTWGCRTPSCQMYDRGSLFLLDCDAPPRLEKIQALQRGGLGIRRAEGFGQVLFFPPERLAEIDRKERLTFSPASAARRKEAAQIRQARYNWVSAQIKELRKYKLSKSQLGTIQALCEESMAAGNTGALFHHLQKNLEDRGAQHGERFEKIDQLVKSTLDENTSLAEIIGVPSCEDSLQARLELLCLLFNFSRKTGEVL